MWATHRQLRNPTQGPLVHNLQPSRCLVPVAKRGRGTAVLPRKGEEIVFCAVETKAVCPLEMRLPAGERLGVSDFADNSRHRLLSEEIEPGAIDVHGAGLIGASKNQTEEEPRDVVIRDDGGWILARVGDGLRGHMTASVVLQVRRNGPSPVGHLQQVADGGVARSESRLLGGRRVVPEAGVKIEA